MRHVKEKKATACFIDDHSGNPYAYVVYMYMKLVLNVDNVETFTEIIYRPPKLEVMKKITGNNFIEIGCAKNEVVEVIKNEKKEMEEEGKQTAIRLADEEQRERQTEMGINQEVNEELEESMQLPVEEVLRDEDVRKTVNVTMQKAKLRQAENEARIQAEWTDGCKPVFISPKFSSLQARLNSYEYWRYGCMQKAEDLAEAGFYYTGQFDMVQCFCCDLVLSDWHSSHNAWQWYARHMLSCWFLRIKKGDGYIDAIKHEWKKEYDPKHTYFFSKQSRFDSFEVWSDDIEQTPSILADAGFYSTGYEDLVRCHYCDIGLYGWRRGIDPWNKNAILSRKCKYLLQRKGQYFAENIWAMRSRQALREASEQALVSASKTASAMEEVWRVRLEEGEEEKVDVKQLLQENKELKASQLCIECKESQRKTLNMPCGHWMFCEKCCNKKILTNCPKCSKKIQKFIKVFLL